MRILTVEPIRTPVDADLRAEYATLVVAAAPTPTDPELDVVLEQDFSVDRPFELVLETMRDRVRLHIEDGEIVLTHQAYSQHLARLDDRATTMLRVSTALINDVRVIAQTLAADAQRVVETEVPA
jgi:hypothetical protein